MGGYIHPVLSLLLLAAAGSIFVGGFADAFAFLARTPPKRQTSTNLFSSVGQSIPLDAPNVDQSPSLSVKQLRAIQVQNVKGEMVDLASAMPNDGVTILAFIRHLGCFHCWSYVHAWSKLQEEMSNDDNLNINGPIFVSIGDPDRLQDFLDKNPSVNPDQMFVDGYDFAAFKEAGFGRFDQKPEELTTGVEPKPIELGGAKGWWTFLSSFMQLAPVTEDMQFPEMLSPEGLLWVGGTFVIRNDNVVYRWNDRISGDHPEASDILEIAKQASVENISAPSSKEGGAKGLGLPNFQKLFGFLS